MRVLWAIMLSVVLCNWAQASEAEVRAFIAGYDSEYSARKVEALAVRLSPDYRVTVDGKTMDRNAALAELQTQSSAQVRSQIEQIHVQGDLAAARGTVAWTSGERSGQEHFLMVLRREQGEWKALMEHISPVE